MNELGHGSQLAFDGGMPYTVESVVRSRTNGPLIAAAAALWIKEDDRVLDVTYGRGLFWTLYRPEHFTTHDLAIDGVDFRDLPEDDCSFDVVVFDPPYVSRGGLRTSTITSYIDRYGLDSIDGPDAVSGSLDNLIDLIEGGMGEAYRVLAPKGRLLVKCMDFVAGGGYQSMRHRVVDYAFGLDLKQVDEFVHHSGIGPQPSGRTQRTSRRAHSFLCVFQK